jgi:hypothetical protein
VLVLGKCQDLFLRETGKGNAILQRYHCRSRCSLFEAEPLGLKNIGPWRVAQ